MNRESIIEILLGLAGSIGPDTKMDNMQDFEEIYEKNFRFFDSNTLDTLLDILINPPYVARPIDFELTKAIVEIGKRNEEDCLKRIKPLIYIEQARPVIIDVIGGLKDENGIILLEQLLGEELTNEDMIKIVDNLTEINGEKAKEILMRLKANCLSPEVLEEINVCLKYFE